MSCTICQHPKRQEIDQALTAGSATLNVLSREFGLSTSALHRHKAHLQANLNRAGKQLRNNLFQTCYFWLCQALDMTMETAKVARTEGNFKLLLQSVSQGTRLINILTKQDFPLEDRMVHAIVTSSKWPAQSGLLPDDPDILARVRESMAVIFSNPCPDGQPPAPPEATELYAPQALSTNPIRPLTKAATQKPKTGNATFNKWEKSGKSAGNDCYILDKDEEYRLLELEKKIAQLDFKAITRGLSPAAATAREEEIFQELWDSIPIPTDKPLSEYLHEQSLK